MNKYITDERLFRILGVSAEVGKPDLETDIADYVASSENPQESDSVTRDDGRFLSEPLVNWIAHNGQTPQATSMYDVWKQILDALDELPAPPRRARTPIVEADAAPEPRRARGTTDDRIRAALAPIETNAPDGEITNEELTAPAEEAPAPRRRGRPSNAEKAAEAIAEPAAEATPTRRTPVTAQDQRMAALKAETDGTATSPSSSTVDADQESVTLLRTLKAARIAGLEAELAALKSA